MTAIPPYPLQQLPALEFITAAPDGTEMHHRVDLAAPISLRDRELLRALLSTAYKLLNVTEESAQAAHGSGR